jgi:hypothetical protein
VGGDRPGQVLALLLGHEEEVDHGVDAAAAMGQGVADFGKVWMLGRGRGGQQAPVDRQGQEDCWAWDWVRQVEVGSSQRPS